MRFPAGHRARRSEEVVDTALVMIAAAGIVVDLVRGDRRLALGAALTNFSLLAYDALFPAGDGGGGLLVLLHYAPSFPAGRQWLAPACVLVLATAAMPLRQLPLTRLPLALVAVSALVALEG